MIYLTQLIKDGEYFCRFLHFENALRLKEIVLIYAFRCTNYLKINAKNEKRIWTPV